MGISTRLTGLSKLIALLHEAKKLFGQPYKATSGSEEIALKVLSHVLDMTFKEAQISVAVLFDVGDRQHNGLSASFFHLSRLLKDVNCSGESRFYPADTRKASLADYNRFMENIGDDDRLEKLRIRRAEGLVHGAFFSHRLETTKTNISLTELANIEKAFLDIVWFHDRGAQLHADAVIALDRNDPFHTSDVFDYQTWMPSFFERFKFETIVT